MTDKNSDMSKNKDNVETRSVKTKSFTDYLIPALFIIPLIIFLVALGNAFWKHSSSNDSSDFIKESKTPTENVATIGGVEFLKVGAENDVKVALFFDPMCGSCGRAERALGDTFSSLANSGEAQILLAPLNFLDKTSTDHYSSRAGSAVVTVHQDKAIDALTLMKFIYSSDFQPEEGAGYKSVSNLSLLEKARSIQNPKNHALIEERIDKSSYANWITENTEASIKSKLFFPTEDDFGTPSIFVIKGDNKPVPVEFTKDKGMKTALLEAVEKAKDSK